MFKVIKPPERSQWRRLLTYISPFPGVSTVDFEQVCSTSIIRDYIYIHLCEKCIILMFGGISRDILISGAKMQ